MFDTERTAILTVEFKHFKVKHISSNFNKINFPEIRVKPVVIYMNFDAFNIVNIIWQNLILT